MTDTQNNEQGSAPVANGDEVVALYKELNSLRGEHRSYRWWMAGVTVAFFVSLSTVVGMQAASFDGERFMLHLAVEANHLKPQVVSAVAAAVDEKGDEAVKAMGDAIQRNAPALGAAVDREIDGVIVEVSDHVRVRLGEVAERSADRALEKFSAIHPEVAGESGKAEEAVATLAAKLKESTDSSVSTAQGRINPVIEDIKGVFQHPDVLKEVARIQADPNHHERFQNLLLDLAVSNYAAKK